MNRILYRILPLLVILFSHIAMAQFVTQSPLKLQFPVLTRPRPLPAVPEPTAAAAFALGAVLVVGAMRRRR
ncbi:MAG: PEP-CTERM sorting domain-containing protein [Deltaproteobacteria bacterium]|nr:PEP-CTERM sorting domain-containing protein [Deltaproteobacteria bacterium]MBW2396700.1 PEP-CTERM sorting domain-containing protein [Deltaproteobacteria bacterium]